LLAKVGHAEKDERPSDRHMGDEGDKRHQRGAGTEGELPRAINGSPTPDEMAGDPTATEAANAGCGVRDPGESADGFDIEPARVVEVLRQPEEVEIPCGIAEELGDDEAAGLAEAEEVQPRGFRGIALDGRQCGGEGLALRDGEARMPVRGEVHAPPEEGPCETKAAGDEEDEAPIRVAEDGRDQGGGDNRADGGAGIDDAHGRGALAGREPLGHRAGGRGETAPLPHPEEQPADDQHGDRRREPVAGACHGPEDHDPGKSGAGAKGINQSAATGVHDAVCCEECGIEEGESFIGDGDLVLDRLDRHGQRLAVQVADGYGRARQECNAPPERRKARWLPG